MIINKISDKISYIKASKEPLSSDVVIIKGENYTYLFDVGSNEEACDYINSITGEKCVILSHFHRDHTYNMDRITYSKAYGGVNTKKYFPQVIPVSEKVYIKDGVDLCIFPFPSSHAKGSVGIVVDNKYIIVGDAIYPAYKDGRAKYNVSLLNEEIKTLKSIEAEYILTSHREKFVNMKDTMVEYLSRIYGERTPGNPYIDWLF